MMLHSHSTCFLAGLSLITFNCALFVFAQELRADNVTLRAQLLGELAPEAARQREAAAHVSALRAAESDAATRDALKSARREQVATSLALLSQLRRMQALEAMRLRDLQVTPGGGGCRPLCLGLERSFL